MGGGAAFGHAGQPRQHPPAARGRRGDLPGGDDGASRHLQRSGVAEQYPQHAFSRSRRSLARSASSRLPSAWRISHWAWIARCQAWAAPTPWSISMSAASSRPGSSSSARCAEKIAASFSSPLSLACCRLPCTSSRTRCRAWSRARCSSGRCRPSSAGRLMAPSRARGPLARPGEAQTPVRVPATAAGRAASPGAMARGASFGAPRWRWRGPRAGRRGPPRCLRRDRSPLPRPVRRPPGP